ncbi:MAG: response regulator [Chryseolinea sp.]
MKRLVVVIDDDPEDLALMKEAIATVDASVNYVGYSDPVDAIQTLLEEKTNVPQYIFIDLNMPKLMGDTCLKILREADHLQHVVIAMISTSMTTSDSQALKNAGASFTYAKPNKMDGYYTILNSIFSNK